MQAVPSEYLPIDRKDRANKPYFDLDLRPVQDRTHDGKPFRMLVVIDEHTRECLAIEVDRALRPLSRS